MPSPVCELEQGDGGCTLNGEAFEPIIWQGAATSAPLGVNVVQIALPAGPKNDLNWGVQKDQALAAIEEGRYILWHLDFGPLTSRRLWDQAESAADLAAAGHFASLFLPKFLANTIGVCFYSGPVPSASLLMKDPVLNERYRVWECEQAQRLGATFGNERWPRLFARNLLLESSAAWLALLPPELGCFLFFDLRPLPTLVERLEWLSCPAFAPYTLALMGSAPSFNAFVWEGARAFWPIREKKPRVGFLLPPEQPMRQSEMAFCETVLPSLPSPCRIIPEADLSGRWDGLDDLIVIAPALSVRGRRLLSGFDAAGGRIVTVGGRIGCEGEVDFDSWSQGIRT